MAERVRPSGDTPDAHAFGSEAFDAGRLVFISHNVRDRNVAERIGMFLVADRIGVWYDEWELSAGDSIVGKVDAALATCTHFLVVWSANANTSKWVREELETALASRLGAGRPRIIPIVLDDTPLPPMLAKLKYVRYSGDLAEDRRLVIEAVTGRSPDTTFARALVGLFNEVIVEEDPPVGVRWNYCPRCGSDDLSTWGVDDWRDGCGEGYTRCNECGYQDCTALW